jgi:nucleotide-binding universal stress UspA family protein
MFPIRKILAPVDFSGRSLDAANYAASMAARLGAELTVLHVLPPLAAEFSMVEVAPGSEGGHSAEHVTRVREALQEVATSEAGLRVQRIVAEGDPAAQIVHAAHLQSADLIVMPTHGGGTIRNFLLGSVASKVLHDTECPVWTGVQLESHSGSFAIGHVLCAVDLGPRSADVLCRASALARHFGSRLTVLHVSPRLSYGEGEAVGENLERQLTEQYRARLKTLAEDTHSTGELMVESGEAAKKVAEVAGRTGADLVVIGRGAIAGRTGRLRATSYAIIRQSHCAVLSV